MKPDQTDIADNPAEVARNELGVPSEIFPEDGGDCCEDAGMKEAGGVDGGADPGDVGSQADTGDCPGGPVDEECNGLDDDCDGLVDEDTGGSECSIINEWGQCPGTNECIGGKLTCFGPEPMPEACDWADNNCDGQIDEGFGTVECGLGVCHHVAQVCSFGQIQVCDPLEGASGEVCDSLDNDCDGQTDEGLTDYECGIPQIVSEPVTQMELEQAQESEFEPGEIFLASSLTHEIRVYDAETLELLKTFDHPTFSEAKHCPRGLAFNEMGNLVVASNSVFIEFSDYGVEFATYPKADVEPTENVIFDSLGNMYTTTATGGSDKLNKYLADGYLFEKTIVMPAGAGQLTGITFDYYDRLYVASQSDNSIHVFQATPDFTEFEWLKALSGAGNPRKFEGLQIGPNGDVLAAAGDIIRYDFESGEKVGSFDAPNDNFPVPITVDNQGRIYASDFENGSGSVSADVFRFTSTGDDFVEFHDDGLFGPFGLAISGTILVGVPPVLYSYQVEAVDINGDELLFSLVKAPPGMFINPETGLIQWYVTSAQTGVYEVVVKVTDGTGKFATQEFTLEIK